MSDIDIHDLQKCEIEYGTLDGKVYLKLNIKVSWIELTPAEAKKLAEALISTANTLTN